jgi:lysophospholipase L1-like esterase
MRTQQLHKTRRATLMMNRHSLYAQRGALASSHAFLTKVVNRLTGLAIVSLFTLTCSTPTLPSTTTVIPSPAITCPVAPAPVTTTNGQSAVVTYGTASVTGGTPPISVTCAPPSGSSFNLGSTSAACTATDAVRRTASCSFAITVVAPPPRLSVANFLAFGDSITAGEIPDCTDTSCSTVVQPTLAYPADLQTMLLQRYTAQTVAVRNDGNRDETAVGGMARLDGELVVFHPDVLLLLEGVNDLDPNNPTSSMQSALNALQSMIQDAHGRSVRVIISTLLPEVPVPGPGNRAKSASLIQPFNNLLGAMALRQGALLVDMYTDFENGNLSAWISPLDGLHPTAAGYQEMARVFFNKIQTTFELPPATTVTLHRPGSLRTSPSITLRPTER